MGFVFNWFTNRKDRLGSDGRVGVDTYGNRQASSWLTRSAGAFSLGPLVPRSYRAVPLLVPIFQAPGHTRPTKAGRAIF